MKSRTLLLIVTFVLLISVVSAQEPTPEYRLRVLSAEEYIAQLPDFNALAFNLSSEAVAQLIETADSEFWFRYSEAADFQTLSNAFDKLKFTAHCQTGRGCSEVINFNFWLQQMAQAWLNENAVDLNQTSEFQFADNTVTVERRDVNADGLDEWLLNLVQTDVYGSVIYSNVLVVEGTVGRYHVIRIPVPWYQYHEHYMMDATVEEAFEDLNHDGVPEWVFSTDTALSSPGSFNIFHSTYILTWREQRFVVLLELDGLVTITDVDADPAKELIRTDTIEDNWLCQINTTTVFDWNGSEYLELEPRTESSDCTARQAEEAMWADDFQSAAQLYEQFLAAHVEDYAEYVACMNESSFGRTECAKYSVYYFDYFLVRRVIAYALLGDEKKLQASLAALRATPYPTEFGEAILDAQPNIVESLCQAAYDYYDKLPVPEWRLVQQKMAIIPGIIIENINDGRDYSIGYNLDPNLAGCDLTLFNDVPTPTPTITPTLYPTYPPPTPDTQTQEEKWLEYGFASSAFDAGNYELVLQIAEKHQDSGSEDDNMQMRYYRALALEALNRPDEALAEYVAIAEAAPDSAWAKLAALHFEPAP